MTVDLLTVSNILDYSSGCRIKRASDQGIGSLPFCIACKGVEFFGRKSRAKE